MNLLKQIPYIIILFLIIVIMFKDCGGGQGSEVKTDTVTVTKIDTTYKEVKGTATITPKIITVADTINHYITQTEACDKPHLNDKGIDLIKHRTYSDTVNIKGYFVSYDMALIGELQSINLALNGNIPTIRQSTVRTVTNDVTKYRSLGFTFIYNQSPQIGVVYQNNNLGYGLNYDAKFESIGAQLIYTPFKW